MTSPTPEIYGCRLTPDEIAHLRLEMAVVTLQQARDITGLSLKTLRTAIRRGHLAETEMETRPHTRVRVRDLNRYLDSRRIAPRGE